MKAKDLMIPVLRESEDERIREALIDIIQSKERDGYMVINNVSTGSILAWLEKQGKKEQDERYEDLEKLLAADDIYQMAMNDAMVEEAKEKAAKALSELSIGKLLGFEKQGEPFDDNIITHDDEILQAISIGLTDAEKDLGWSDFGGLPIEEIQKWLEKQGKQKPDNKWSEEDEELLQHCCGAVAAADYYTLEDKEEMENWLKSLKQRMEEE